SYNARRTRHAMSRGRIRIAFSWEGRMTRSLLYLAIAATLANAPGSCAKSGSNQSAAATGGGSAASGGDWTSLGATACAKYFTPDLTCALHTDGGDISITLIADGAAGFDAFSKNLVDPRPLAGVGDKALQSMIGI